MNVGVTVGVFVLVGVTVGVLVGQLHAVGELVPPSVHEVIMEHVVFAAHTVLIDEYPWGDALPSKSAFTPVHIAYRPQAFAVFVNVGVAVGVDVGVLVKVAVAVAVAVCA